MKKIYFLFLLLITGTVSYGQVGLGDLIITSYNSDTGTGTDGKSFSFMTLIDLPANTLVSFTDNAWIDDAMGFRTGEGTVNWNSGASIITKGTIIYLYATVPGTPAAYTASLGATTYSGSLNFSTTGDQLFVYNTGNVPSSSNLSGFITAINMDGIWVTTGNSTNNSAKPSIFTDGLNSFYLSTERDNAVYNCSLVIGTATQLRAAIYNEANWTSDDTVLYGTASCSFTLGIGKDDISGFSLYPNPVKGGKVFISSANNYAERSVAVFDVLGKQVVSQNGTQNSIDVSHLNKGVYIIKVAEEGKVATRKLVIE